MPTLSSQKKVIALLWDERGREEGDEPVSEEGGLFFVVKSVKGSDKEGDE